MLVKPVNCRNNYRCWECSENCFTKSLFILPEPVFMNILHDTYSASVGTMMALGLPMKKAEEIQNIKTMSIIVARQKFLESQK